MKRIEFENNSAQKIYDDYLKRIERCTIVLSEEDTKDLMMEFNSHIYEGLQKNQTGNEIEELLNIIEKLGAPEEVLKPPVAVKKLYQATRTFNPRHVFQAIKLNLKNSLVFAAFGVVYLPLVVFILLIPAKIFFPNVTGLFYSGSKFQGFGIIINHGEFTEMLGYWFIPIVISVIIILYFIITLLLRLLNKK